MHQILDDIRQQLNIPRYDINDDTSLTMTQDQPRMENGMDANLEKYMDPARYKNKNHGLDNTDADLGNTLEASMKSKTSKVSTEPSADTYNFKSTEDDDVYSTIRSDMNNTANLAGTQTLKTYQASINEREELEEGEIPQGTLDNYTVSVTEIREEDERSASEINGVVTKKDEEEADDDDDYDDDDYEDDGDDESEDEDGPHTTEPTATYRTDDDDDF